MPYCVACGVELNCRAKQCPLCSVEVILPAALLEPNVENSLPQQRDVADSAFDKNLWIQVVSVLMAIPALLSVVIDAAFGHGLTWSIYVVAALGAAWVWCVSPFLYRRNIVALWIAIDALALVGLLYLTDFLSAFSGWFLPVAVPITLSVTGLTLLIIELARRKLLRELHIVAAILIAVGVLCMIVEAAVDLYFTTFRLQWSLLVVASCTPLALIAGMLQRRRAVVEGMKFWLRM
jgi:hypothetical protein